MEASTSIAESVALQFSYVYQHIARGVAYEEDHNKLAELCSERLELDSLVADLSCYPWRCYSHTVSAEYDLLKVSIRFEHNRFDNQSALSVPDVSQLWLALVELFNAETSHKLFGGRGCEITMRPLNVSTGLAQQFTFAKVFLDKPPDISHLMTEIKATEASDLRLAVDKMLCMVEETASYMVANVENIDWAVKLATQLGHSISPEFSLCDQALQIGVDALADFYHRTLPASTYKPSFDYNLLWTQMCKALISREALKQMAQTTALIRTKTKPQDCIKITQQELCQVVDLTKGLLFEYQTAYVAASSALRQCLRTRNTSLKAYVAALQGVRKLENLWKILDNGTKTLVALLKQQRKENSATKLAYSGASVMAPAAALALGPPGVVGFLGFGCLAAVGPNMVIKALENGKQVEELCQDRLHVERLHRELFYITVASAASVIWNLDLGCMDSERRVQFLTQNDVPEEYHSCPGLVRARIDAALDEFDEVHKELKWKIDGVILDLNVQPETIKTTKQRLLMVGN